MAGIGRPWRPIPQRLFRTPATIAGQARGSSRARLADSTPNSVYSRLRGSAITANGRSATWGRSSTNAAIAAAALAVLDRDGVAGLSMRSVAAELRVGTMSLYRYVSDRPELERLVLPPRLAGGGPRQPQ